MTMKCLRCGVEFEPKDRSPSHLRRRPPKYCSHDCGKMARYSKVILKCRVCQQSFERKRYMGTWSKERGPFCGFRCYAHWQKENTVGPANPNYQARAHSHLRCDWCGKEFVRRTLDHRRRSVRLAFCSRPCFQEYAAERFPRHSLHYSSATWRRARLRALRRDKERCVDCGACDDLVVHHLVPFASFEGRPEANVLDNLATLCRACHRRRHNRQK